MIEINYFISQTFPSKIVNPLLASLYDFLACDLLNAVFVCRGINRLKSNITVMTY